MTQAVSPARWRAVTVMQSLRAHARFNSLEYDSADHAISLALSPQRPEGAFLAKNAYRDGRSIVLRQRKREAARNVPLFRPDDGSERPEIAVETQRRPDAAYLHSLPQGPESDFIWKQTYDRLRQGVAGLNGYAGGILDGWRDGEEVEETARRLGISAAYVKKIRQLVRGQAVLMFGTLGSG